MKLIIIHKYLHKMSISSDEKIVFSIGSLSDRESSKRFSNHSTTLLFIVLDCLYYVAGDKVNGEILLNLPIDYPEASLKLTLKGYEHVQIPKKSQSIIASIYNLETIVNAWGNKAPAGQYVFPFTFRIPGFAPSTFSFYGIDDFNNAVSAEIIYEASCILEFLKNEEKNLMHTRFINIRNIKTRNSPSPS